MIRRPPRSTRTDTLFPYTTLFRSKTHLQELLGSALDQLLAGTEAVRPAINLDATKDAKFGDFQTNPALQLAKPLGKPPRAVAEAIVTAVPAATQLAHERVPGTGSTEEQRDGAGDGSSGSQGGLRCDASKHITQ